MSTKKTYWLTDGYGNKAYVEGVEERDAWVPRGWSESTEPAGEDKVWLQHSEHGGRQLFAAASVESWKVLGWQPSAPPEPVDVLHDPQLVDVPDEPAPARPEPVKPAAPAGGESKEK